MESDERTFSCHRCGQRFAWHPEYAGRKFSCGCGNVMEVPPPPPPDAEVTYDLAPDQPTPDRLRIKTHVVDASGVSHTVDGANASAPPPPQRVLTYQNPGARTIQAIEDSDPKQRDYYLPISLIIFGAFVTIVKLCWDARTPAEVVWALAEIGKRFFIELNITFFAIVVAAKVLDVSFGTVGLAILKLGAIALGPLGVWFLVWAAVPTVSGLALGYMLSIPVYWWLFSYLFELDFRETLICVTLATLMRWIAYFALIRLL